MISHFASRVVRQSVFILVIVAAQSWARGADAPPIVDKTLVAWVSPANLSQRGGSVLTIDDQHGHFDGIVFGEISPGRWMAGSDFYRRTSRAQEQWPQESATAGTVVQLAISYKGRLVTIYRDGRQYAQYSMDADPQAFDEQCAVVIGKRHLDQQDDAGFVGTIYDARIYGVALSAGQIAALKPREVSEPQPLAWWKFAEGKARDATGRFADGMIGGKARVEGGKLVLEGSGGFMVTPGEAARGLLGREIASSAAMPVYHFTSPTGRDCSPFDPNGAIFFKGRYHLGYIYQDGGRHYWGHASTADLIHWKMHPPMLSPGPEGGIFSGNAFFDKNGRVVLSYHGLGNGAYPAGNCLAVAADEELNIFKKLPQNPVMKDPGWDPHTWFEAGVYYSISGGNPGSGKTPSLYTSTDDTLAKWTLAGPLMSNDMPDVDAREDISCPDMFRLGDKRILLCISHMRGARYYVGRFENKQFHPEAHFRMNWPGGTCFAPETLLDEKGRRIMWAWVLGSPSTMTLPRVLSMGADSVMHIEPAEELNALRKNPQLMNATEVPADKVVMADGIAGDCKELHVSIDPRQSAQCGVIVRMSPDGAEQTAIVYDPARKTLSIQLDKSSLNKDTRPRTYAMTFMLPGGSPNSQVNAQEAPFELKPGEMLDLHIYLDHSILEVFANGRQCITQRIWPTKADSMGIGFFSRDGVAEVKSLQAWDMSPTTMSPIAGGHQ